MANDRFPMYLLEIDGKKKFYPLREVGKQLNALGHVRAKIVGLVLHEDLTVRDVTRDERWQIAYLASKSEVSA